MSVASPPTDTLLHLWPMLRVVDTGTVPAARSQSLWHGLASAMEPDAPITLSFCRPASAYVGLGYHNRIEEIDLDACREMGLPVIRRRIGGGPVYLDSDQLFFQITLPAARAPRRLDLLYERFLEPAAEAFRRLGLPCRRDGLNDLAVAERKVSGTGAGQIGEAVTVVGNVLFRFPHRRMAEVLALPEEGLRREVLGLMERHVTSLEREGLSGVGMDDARDTLVACYAEALGKRPEPGEIAAREEEQMTAWEERFADPAWLAGPRRPRGASEVRRVKISAGAWLLAAANDGLRLQASMAGGRLEKVALSGASLDGATSSLTAALNGAPLDAGEIQRRLTPFGEMGQRVLETLEPGLRSP